MGMAKEKRSNIKNKRHPINFRKLFEHVDPIFMTTKEFIHYLFYIFEINVAKGWDGIERQPYTPNWTEEPSHNIETRAEAIDFLRKLNKERHKL